MSICAVTLSFSPEVLLQVGARLLIFGIWIVAIILLLATVAWLRSKLYPVDHAQSFRAALPGLSYRFEKDLRRQYIPIVLYMATLLIILGSALLLASALSLRSRFHMPRFEYLQPSHPADLQVTVNVPPIPIKVVSVPAPAPSPSRAYSINWPSGLGSLCIAAMGAILVLFSMKWPSYFSRLAGTSLLLLGVAPKMANTFRIDTLFKTEVKQGESSIGTTKPQTRLSYVGLGRISGFGTGCPVPNPQPTDCSHPDIAGFFDAKQQPSSRETLFTLVCKQTNVVFITGRADRSPLQASLRNRYDSNVGLAQARAESIKKAVATYCPEVTTTPPPFVTQPSGPRLTPIEATKPDATFEDRSVDLYTFGQQISSETSSSAEAHSYPKWLGPVALAVLLLVAFSLTEWSWKFEWKDGKPVFSAEGKPKKDKTGPKPSVA